MLFLLPFDREPDWRRAPVVVIGLILLNCIIYFGFQGGDDRVEADATGWYHDSGLWKSELPAYREYLRQHAPEQVEEFDRQLEFDDGGTLTDYAPYLPLELEFDPLFHKALPGLVPSDSPGHARWQEDRAHFEAILERSVIHRFSLRPALATPVTVLSHMFLHASIGHLAGNMLFLFVVGFVVEATLGSGFFLIIYLLAGIGAAVPDLLLHADSLVYHLGASGAISGVMAAYAVLFGMRRIHFFYNFLLWFDRIRAPAIIMLPLWLANEALQLLLYPGSHVNYWAHMGGLLSGALLTAGARRFTKRVDEEYLNRSENAAALDKALEEGLKRLGELRYPEARRIFARLVQEHPERTDLLQHLHTASRNEPDCADYHDSCRRLILDAGTAAERRRQVFEEYVGKAKPHPRLSADESATLARLLLEEGAVGHAERLVLALMKRNPAHPQLLPLLKRLAQRVPAERAARYQRLVLQLTGA